MNFSFRTLLKKKAFLIIVPGLGSALFITNTVSNALGLGAATLAVLTASNIAISLLGKRIPDSMRIPAYIFIIAAFVSLVDIILKFYLPILSESLGMFVPLIVANYIILGRAEAFAAKNSVWASAIDAIVMGSVFAGLLITIALVREILGAGTITILNDVKVIKIPGLSEFPIRLAAFPAGALIIAGFLQAFYRWLGGIVLK